MSELEGYWPASHIPGWCHVASSLPPAPKTGQYKHDSVGHWGPMLTKPLPSCDLGEPVSSSLKLTDDDNDTS